MAQNRYQAAALTAISAFSTFLLTVLIAMPSAFWTSASPSPKEPMPQNIAAPTPTAPAATPKEERFKSLEIISLKPEFESGFAYVGTNGFLAASTLRPALARSCR
ncbi:MAG: hypothetical protein J5J00_10730 [Deltaproteobacteria bacterium]|nr:hypothetical protein [Deltaproteobacteria bacterium]